MASEAPREGLEVTFRALIPDDRKNPKDNPFKNT